MKRVYGGMNQKDVPSSGDTAYEIISGKILSGDLAPGEKLSIRTMAKLTGVSMIPVIDALHRLEYEGLVESFPRWGSRVIALTPEAVRDRSALREAVECQVVRLLAESGLSKEQKNQLLFLAEEIDSSPRTEELESPFWERHYEFHLRLAEYTGCQSLVKALHNVNLFRLLQRNVIEKKEIFSLIPTDLHKKIIQGIIDKKPDKAERAMREHIRLSALAARDVSKS